jgi:hypothetical protein
MTRLGRSRSCVPQCLCILKVEDSLPSIQALESCQSHAQSMQILDSACKKQTSPKVMTFLERGIQATPNGVKPRFLVAYWNIWTCCMRKYSSFVHKMMKRFRGSLSACIRSNLPPNRSKKLGSAKEVLEYDVVCI